MDDGYPFACICLSGGRGDYGTLCPAPWSGVRAWLFDCRGGDWPDPWRCWRGNHRPSAFCRVWRCHDAVYRRVGTAPVHVVVDARPVDRPWRVAGGRHNGGDCGHWFCIWFVLAGQCCHRHGLGPVINGNCFAIIHGKRLAGYGGR